MNIFHKIDRENRKKDIPEFIAGDTLKLQVRVKEGEKTRTQPFEGLSFAVRAVVPEKPSQSERFPMALVLKEPSLCIHHLLLILKLSAAVMSAELNFII